MESFENQVSTEREERCLGLRLGGAWALAGVVACRLLTGVGGGGCRGRGWGCAAGGESS